MALLSFSRAAGILSKLGLRPYLLKARSYLSNPHKTWTYDSAIRRDYRTWRREARPWLQQSNFKANRQKKVLIVSLSPVIYRIKLETLFARALYERGYEPFFLVYKHTPIPNHPSAYFHAARFGQTLYFEDYQPSQDAIKEKVREETKRLLAEKPSPQEFANLTYRGVYLGEHLLSSLSRTLHLGRIDLQRPDASAFVRRVLPEVLGNVHAAESLMDQVNPDLVLFNDTSYTHYGPIHDIAINRGCNAVQFTYIAEDDALIWKRCTAETRRTHPNSLSPQSWKSAKSMLWTSEMDTALDQHFRDRYGERWYMSRRNQHKKIVKAKKQVQQDLGLNSDKKTVVLFSHILWDANLFYGEDLFEDFGEWFLETVRIAYENSSVNWVIKLHPGNIWKRISEGWNDTSDEVRLIESKLGPLPSHVRLLPPETELNTFSMFAVTDYAITVRGTIGIELSCFGVPVFTAGTGRYSDLGFTIDSKTKEEYLKRLQNIQEYPPLTPKQKELARRHAYTLFILRPWRFQSVRSVFKPVEQGNHPLAWDLELKDPKQSELSTAPDFKALVDWLEDSARIDYLERPPDNGESHQPSMVKELRW